jgi:hypothetical protein
MGLSPLYGGWVIQDSEDGLPRIPYFPALGWIRARRKGRRPVGLGPSHYPPSTSRLELLSYGDRCKTFEVALRDGLEELLRAQAERCPLAVGRYLIFAVGSSTRSKLPRRWVKIVRRGGPRRRASSFRKDTHLGGKMAGWCIFPLLFAYIVVTRTSTKRQTRREAGTQSLRASSEGSTRRRQPGYRKERCGASHLRIPTHEASAQASAEKKGSGAP